MYVGNIAVLAFLTSLSGDTAKVDSSSQGAPINPADTLAATFIDELHPEVLESSITSIPVEVIRRIFESAEYLLTPTARSAKEGSGVVERAFDDLGMLPGEIRRLFQGGGYFLDTKTKQLVLCGAGNDLPELIAAVCTNFEIPGYIVITYVLTTTDGSATGISRITTVDDD